MAAAKETADTILEDAREAVGAAEGDEEMSDAFSKAVKDNTDSDATSTYTRGSYLNSVYAEWAKDSARKPGDTEVIEDASGYYVMLYIARDANDYKSVAVRHILIKAVPDAVAYTTPSSV